MHSPPFSQLQHILPEGIEVVWFGDVSITIITTNTCTTQQRTTLRAGSVVHCVIVCYLQSIASVKH